MSSREPESADRGPGRRLSRDVGPAAAVGVLMGLLAAKEGAGAAVAVVVAFVGCAIVLGMLALKR